MSFKFSGHETFPCRYAWLPKSFAALSENPHVFSDDDNAMVVLGIGKNMVRAIKFWIQAIGIAEIVEGSTFNITDFGRTILSQNGLDPFLEDIRTLWLIHWRLSTYPQEPLFAWSYMLNQWHQPEISKSAVVPTFRREADKLGRELSEVTLTQHFEVFMHTYVPTRGRKGGVQEDNLDCPLVELELIHKIGERGSDSSGRREDIFAFRREEKPEITPGLFMYCLEDHWRKNHPNERTLSFRDVSIAYGSPGQIFKLPELEIRHRLEEIEDNSNGAFIYSESASVQQVIRDDRVVRPTLSSIYD